MSRIRIIGLALAAVFAMSATASASAAEYIYKVAGAKLEAGVKTEITSKAKTTFVLKGEVLGIKSETKCKTEKLNAAEKPVIVGGAPGTSEKELVEFGECSATLGGAACKSVKVNNTTTSNEIVTVVLPAAKAGKLATLFTPPTKVFTTIELKECGAFGTQKAEVTGTTAALDSPEKVEQATGTLIFKAGAEEITEVGCLKETTTCTGAEKKAPFRQKVGLKFGGNAATLEGESEVSLVSGQSWGVY